MCVRPAGIAPGMNASDSVFSMPLPSVHKAAINKDAMMIISHSLFANGLDLENNVTPYPHIYIPYKETGVCDSNW